VVIKENGRIICEILVVDVHSARKVRLGFTADKSVLIDRLEIHEGKQSAGRPPLNHAGTGPPGNG
jgi:sRNA-binding carbon storage regulator CsrA